MALLPHEIVVEFIVRWKGHQAPKCNSKRVKDLHCSSTPYLQVTVELESENGQAAFSISYVSLPEVEQAVPK